MSETVLFIWCALRLFWLNSRISVGSRITVIEQASRNKSKQVNSGGMRGSPQSHTLKTPWSNTQCLHSHISMFWLLLKQYYHTQPTQPLNLFWELASTDTNHNLCMSSCFPGCGHLRCFLEIFSAIKTESWWFIHIFGLTQYSWFITHKVTRG